LTRVASLCSVIHAMVDGEGSAPANGATTQQAEQPPAWFVEHLAVLDKRFEGLASKLRGPSPATTGDEPAQGTSPSAPAPVTASDIQAARAYESTRHGLTDSQRTRLDALEQQGWTYSQLSQVAELLRTSRAPANGAAPPPGLASTAAPNHLAPGIRSVSELRSLKVKNPDAYKAWIADPSNDISKLANR
jgi:hypothetical protein